VDEVVIGEAVVLEVPIARFPSRMVARVIDLVAQGGLLFIVLLTTGAAAAGGDLDLASVAAVFLTSFILVIVGYPTIFETLTRGKSLGKLAMGLRVVSDDGGPERFRQAFVRALLGVLEFWILFGIPALIASLLSAKGKRLGDMLAGTYVIQERVPGRKTLAAPLAVVPPALAGWASTLQLSGLSDATAETARSYLSRFHELTPAAREEFGRRITSAVQAQVSPLPPPGTPATAYLSAVLAERRSREHARIMAYGPSAAGQRPFAGYGQSPGAQPSSAAQPFGSYGQSREQPSSAAQPFAGYGQFPGSQVPPGSQPAPGSPPAPGSQQSPEEPSDAAASVRPPGFLPPA
jgi:uncharacterized RDD family membrane protein YckC